MAEFYKLVGHEVIETMIFGPGDEDRYQDRCSTYHEAIEMHNKAVEYAKAKLN